MSVRRLINEGISEDDDVLREAMTGNLCRCVGYLNIIDAVRAAFNDGQGDSDAL